MRSWCVATVEVSCRIARDAYAAEGRRIRSRRTPVSLQAQIEFNKDVKCWVSRSRRRCPPGVLRMESTLAEASAGAAPSPDSHAYLESVPNSN